MQRGEVGRPSLRGGLLLAREAGGITNAVPVEQMLQHGGRVLAVTPAIYPLLERLTDQTIRLGA